MMHLPKSRDAWPSVHFKTTLKQELEAADAGQLPLQKGLALSSYVSEEPFSVIVISATDDATTIRVKASILYTGIIAGCSCADDPTPLDTQTEYCELQLEIDKLSAEARIKLLAT
ncbi:MAG: hypothetical protein KZQ96_15035 [Candidatus Thiodiazotropha sp. (ex Lucinoma borealis)]|nr:hypothetical protein [Candidatus Thiodiazotropha sp. (ex Lucinoma borealis)]MCU7837745.1 hypothetical protein [Candidatus Thiodiazotropha sp. (ex Troendleina suluensis)]MCU7857695.1 hypothetical protein [Candidatus Thiodiazotropha sp. (ex Lucinoma borealis)]MCU7867789.1 hypothetical protein [Candidatus Thiodiazotropha sp. (ex Lucinoma borealis)]MCU7947507.1 hypothetical protein [Candidatus Thiodiazotropha sp. (ex Cardiolucina cf. quadrata)]